VRQAAVTWVQSMVRDPVRREILAELAQLAPGLPPGPYADRVRMSLANLERMWLEP
jgi:PKHD-type hydroxylase